MARPKGSKNKPKVASPVTVVKRPRGRPRKIDMLIAAKVPKPSKRPEEKVLPNVDFEDNDGDNDFKIVQCPYMGPDADDSELFVRQQVVGNRKWNEEDIGESFSINIDSLY
jgi:hypothetical protein